MNATPFWYTEPETTSLLHRMCDHVEQNGNATDAASARTIRTLIAPRYDAQTQNVVTGNVLEYLYEMCERTTA